MCFAQPRRPPTEPRRYRLATWLEFIPGAALCLLISAVALGIQAIEVSSFGHPYVEAIVMRFLSGMIIRAFWVPGSRWQPGIAVSAKQLLEVAVMLLGASLSLSAIGASGPLLFGAVVAIVAASLAFTYGICRILGFVGQDGDSDLVRKFHLWKFGNCSRFTGHRCK